MVEAAKTTGSTADIWAIVIVAVVALATWLAAIMLADRSQVRASGPARAPGEAGPVGPGSWAGGSVAGARAPEIPGEAAHEPVRTPGRPARDESAREGEMPTSADMHAMPRQRTGEADRAERSQAGPGTRDEQQGR
jgi:hypothetical protein